MTDQLSRGVPDQWKPENQDKAVQHYVDGMTGEQVSFEDFDGDNVESDGGATRASKTTRKASTPKEASSDDSSTKGARK